MPADPDELVKLAHDHAWRWFSLHAAQRMQTFYYFLVATAFLIAAYASLLGQNRPVAATVALVGAWIAFWFTRLDIRTLQLIRAGEDVLEAFQARLAKNTNIPALEILKAVENPSFGASLYKTVIGVIEWTIVVVFIVAAAYAGFVG
jgi:hypothetical protein